MTSGRPGLDVRFCVKGIPLPKGSMTAYKVNRNCKACRAGQLCQNPRCHSGKIAGVAASDQGGPELKAWQELIHFHAISARNKAGCRLLEKPGAVSVDLVFVMPRPDGHWAGGELTRSGAARPFPSVTPDIDKLTRAVCDALKGSIIEDDGMVVLVKLGEVYEDKPGGWTGVAVHARQVLSLDAWVEHELAYHGVWAPIRG